MVRHKSGHNHLLLMAKHQPMTLNCALVTLFAWQKRPAWRSKCLQTTSIDPQATDSIHFPDLKDLACATIRWQREKAPAKHKVRKPSSANSFRVSIVFLNSGAFTSCQSIMASPQDSPRIYVLANTTACDLRRSSEAMTDLLGRMHFDTAHIFTPCCLIHVQVAVGDTILGDNCSLNNLYAELVSIAPQSCDVGSLTTQWRQRNSHVKGLKKMCGIDFEILSPQCFSEDES